MSEYQFTPEAVGDLLDIWSFIVIFLPILLSQNTRGPI